MQPKYKFHFLHFVSPVGIPYVGAPTATVSSTVLVTKILGGQTSNSDISHYVQDISTVQPINDHTLPPEIIIAHNTYYYDGDEYIASSGDDSHKYAPEDGDSTSGYDNIEDPHSVNLPLYILRYVR